MEKNHIKERVLGASKGLVYGEALGRMLNTTQKERTEHLIRTGESAMSFDHTYLYGIKHSLDFLSLYREDHKDVELRYANYFLTDIYGCDKDGFVRVALGLKEGTMLNNLDDWYRKAKMVGGSFTDYMLIRCLAVAIVAKTEEELKEHSRRLAKMSCEYDFLVNDMSGYAYILYQIINTGKVSKSEIERFIGEDNYTNNVYRRNLLLNFICKHVKVATESQPYQFTALDAIQKELLEANLQLNVGEQALILSCLGAVTGDRWFDNNYFIIAELQRRWSGIKSFISTFQWSVQATRE